MSRTLGLKIGTFFYQNWANTWQSNSDNWQRSYITCPHTNIQLLDKYVYKFRYRTKLETIILHHHWHSVSGFTHFSDSEHQTASADYNDLYLMSIIVRQILFSMKTRLWHPSVFAARTSWPWKWAEIQERCNDRFARSLLMSQCLIRRVTAIINTHWLQSLHFHPLPLTNAAWITKKVREGYFQRFPQRLKIYF